MILKARHNIFVLVLYLSGKIQPTDISILPLKQNLEKDFVRKSFAGGFFERKKLSFLQIPKKNRFDFSNFMNLIFFTSFDANKRSSFFELSPSLSPLVLHFFKNPLFSSTSPVVAYCIFIRE